MGYGKSGRNVFVGLGIQTGFGVASSAFTYYEPIDVSGFIEEFESKQSEKRAGTRFRRLGRNANKRVPFSFTVEATADTIGPLLVSALGNEGDVSELLAAEAYEHSFSFAETLPYVTVVAYTAGVADSTGSDKAHQLINAKINTLEIKGAMDSEMRVTVSGEATSRSAIAKPTPVFSTEDPFFMKANEGNGQLAIGGSLLSVSPFLEGTEFNLTITNGAAQDRRIDGTPDAAAIREGASEITGSISAIFNAETFAEIEAFQQGEAAAIEATLELAQEFATGHVKTLAVKLGRTKYTGPSVSFDPDLISVEFPFEVELTDDTAITLINADADKYATVI